MFPKVRQTNWKRTRRLGADATLTLLEYEQETGELDLLTLSTDWNAGLGPDNDTSRVTVMIEESPDVTEEIMNSRLARFRINQADIARTYSVVDGGIMPPFARNRYWRVSGEEIRVRE